MIITNSRYALVGYFITSYPTRAHGIIVIYWDICDIMELTFPPMRTLVLVGELGFTTNQETQNDGQRESRMLCNAMDAGLQEVHIYLKLS